MAERYFTKEHEWIEVDGDVATVGISDHAQEQLGDVVFVELPEVGAEFIKDAEAAVVESVKAASEVYAPVSGEIVEVNSQLEEEPGKVNSDPYGEGWFMKIKMTSSVELDELMDDDAYATFVEENS